jgi:hypothetical protein
MNYNKHERGAGLYFDLYFCISRLLFHEFSLFVFGVISTVFFFKQASSFLMSEVWTDVLINCEQTKRVSFLIRSHISQKSRARYGKIQPTLAFIACVDFERQNKGTAAQLMRFKWALAGPWFT